MIPNYLKQQLMAGVRQQGKSLIQSLSFGKSSAKPLFISISHLRAGNRLLHTYLHSHPHIWSHGSILNDNYAHDGQQALQKMEALQQKTFAAPIKYSGMQMLFSYEEDQRKEIFSWIKENPEQVKLIYLNRKNLLRVWVSLQLAEKTQQWYLRNPRGKIAPDKKAIGIPIETCLKALQKLEAQEARVTAMLADVPKMTIEYDGLAHSPQRTLLDIQNYLGLSIRQLYAPLYRQNPEPLSMLIKNYDEVRQALLPTRWASFLAEESRFY